MSYIYGAPSKARNANVVYIYIYIYIYIYGPTFRNAGTVSFYLLHNVSLCQLAGKVFTHKCDTGNLSALIQC